MTAQYVGHAKVEIVAEPQENQTAPPAAKPAKPLAYVAGPYRDARGTRHVEENIRAAEAVAVELWKAGFAVICPHANTRHFEGVVPSEDFIAGDLVMVERCDLVVFLPNWRQSEGARAEKAHADECGVPYYLWMPDWSGGDPARYARLLFQDFTRRRAEEGRDALVENSPSADLDEVAITAEDSALAELGEARYVLAVLGYNDASASVGDLVGRMSDAHIAAHFSLRRQHSAQEQRLAGAVLDAISRGKALYRRAEAAEAECQRLRALHGLDKAA